MTNLNFNDTLIPSDIHIFILEDMRSIQEKIVTDLHKIGFTGRVTIASTLQEAMDKYKESKPQFILSDWNLPDGEGVTFLEEIRQSNEFKEIPFMMMTTVDDVGDILKAMGLGADGYIVKPWSLDDLKNNIPFAYNKRVTIQP